MRQAGAAVLASAILVWLGVAGCAGDELPTGRPENPEQVLLQELAEELNPEVPGLRPFFEAVTAENFQQAQADLIAYFRSRPVPPEALSARLPIGLPVLVSALDAWRGIFSFQGVKGRAAEPDGPIDWSARGPKNDAEWAWFLHRHFFLREMMVLYEKQGHEEFLWRIRDYLLDWFWSFPPPDKRSFSPEWRALEAARRMTESWLPLYDRLRDNPELGDEAVLAIVAGAARHADYLKNHHHYGGNHLVTEMMALATIAAVWPEFRNSGEWMDYAVAKAIEEMDAQVYPDGAHKELANHYQWIAGSSFQKLYEVVAVADREDAREILRPRMEKMWNYYARVMRPDGTGPLNNDSDLEPNAEQIVPLADYFDRPDWLWIASGGKTGTEPDGPPSQWFPWAGHAVLRNGWGREADWVFFDCGPFGTDHQQEDRLHISVALDGRNLLVDSGRYVYRDDAWSRFFRGPFAHNIPTFDRHQRPIPDRESSRPLGRAPVRETDLMMASGAIPLAIGSEWSGSHARAVILGDGFVWIVDRVETAYPDRVTFRWRFAPDLHLEKEGDGAAAGWAVLDAASEDPLARFSVRSQGPLSAEIVSGREFPAIQGWYSPEFNRREANQVLEVSTPVSGVHYFSWLLQSERGREGVTHDLGEQKVFLEEVSGSLRQLVWAAPHRENPRILLLQE